MTNAIALITGALLAALVLPVQAQSLDCAERGVFLKYFEDKYQERPVAHGVNSNGILFELLMSNDGKTWTFAGTEDGVTCHLASGKDWQAIIAENPT